MPSLRIFNTNDIFSVLSFLVFLTSMTLQSPSKGFLVIAALFLAAGISAAVHNAEVIAQRVGPSLGTLILALSVTVIEVALIVSLMGNQGPESHTVARDTVFAAIMIVTNGIIGVCILLGGLKHKELGFQSMGTTALLGVLAVLATLTLVMPNFTTTTAGPTYGERQLIFASLTSVLLYAALVWAQTKSHKNFFEALTEHEKNELERVHLRPSLQRTFLSFFGLILSLVAVVGLAKILSPAIEMGLASMGAPKAAVGVVIALLVLAPETLAAINAAKINQLQTSLNLALGSGAASIALTIPVVSLYSIVSGDPLSLGLDPKSMAFLIITFMAGSFTFGSGRTTALHGIVHLVILASYVGLTFMP